MRPILHVLTDPNAGRGRGAEEQLRAAAAGGADVVQYRDKGASPAEVERTARRLVGVAAEVGVALIVNDHWEIARDSGASGVHLGPDDADPGRVREACPPPFVIGASTRSVARARELEALGVDLLGVGPVYGTTTKPDAPGRIGLERVAEIAREVGVPVIGIGGIDAGNAADVIRAGAAGVAVISAVTGAADPAAAVRALRDTLDRVAGHAPGC